MEVLGLDIYNIYIYTTNGNSCTLPVAQSHNNRMVVWCRGVFLGVSFIRTDQECSLGSRFLLTLFISYK